MENNTKENKEEQVQITPNVQIEEGEIDLWVLAVRFWEKRLFILKVLGVFFVLGLVVALASPKKYSASVIISPQVADAKGSSGLAAAASMFGISMGGGVNSDPITPKMYPLLMNNADLQKELIYTKFKFADQDTLVTFMDYFISEKYNKPTVMSYVKKYTIGLPGVIIGAIKGEEKSNNTVVNTFTESGVHTFTKDESDAVKVFKGMVSVNVNDKDQYITISSMTGEPQFAADLTERTKDLMQKYVTAAKIEKAKANYDFVKARFDEAEKQYQQIQMEYAKFMDANMNITSAVAMTKRTVLEREYQFVSNLYNEVSRLLLQSEIKVKEDTPTFSVVQPVVVPLEKSKPSRILIMIAFIFIGGVVGCGAVLGMDFLKKKEIDNKFVKNWE